jgi:hypothetical protein
MGLTPPLHPPDAVSAFVPLRFVVCDSHVGQGRLRLPAPLTLFRRSFLFDLWFVTRMLGRGGFACLPPDGVPAIVFLQIAFSTRKMGRVRLRLPAPHSAGFVLFGQDFEH